MTSSRSAGASRPGARSSRSSTPARWWRRSPTSVRQRTRVERGFGELLEVYTMIEGPDGEPPLLFETYQLRRSVAAAQDELLRSFVPVLLAALGAFAVLMVPLGWSLARRLQRGAARARSAAPSRDGRLRSGAPAHRVRSARRAGPGARRVVDAPGGRGRGRRRARATASPAGDGVGGPRRRADAALRDRGDLPAEPGGDGLARRCRTSPRGSLTRGCGSRWKWRPTRDTARGSTTSSTARAARPCATSSATRARPRCGSSCAATAHARSWRSSTTGGGSSPRGPTATTRRISDCGSWTT